MLHSLMLSGPLIIFLLVLLYTGSRANRRVKQADNFQKEYFLGSRSLGGVVLAMTLVATYGSVSSYVSGPGLAWNYGLSWVVFAAPQIITGFFLLGILGKRMALLSRATGSLTVIDLMHKRYQSKALCIILALVMLVFFAASIVGQFIGGAQIFAAITGLDYKAGLLMFGIVTVLYTAGGFRAVAITDAICAVLMLVGMFALGWVIFNKGGGLENIMHTLQQDEQSTGKSLMSFNAGGMLPLTLLFSAWLLVGFCTVGLPQSLVRCMSYRDTRDLHRAMWLATVICGALMIGLTVLGVFARGVIRELPANGTDAIIPQLIVNYMHPLTAGITIIGPVAATMSTVSSLLIAASSAVIRDLYIQVRGHEYDDSKARRISRYITFAIGIICLVLAMWPLDVVVWVNMFAFGGLESAFMWPVVLGLFSLHMNRSGALWGVILGLGVYTIFMIFKVNIAGFHNIVFGCLAGFIGCVIGSYLGRPEEREVLQTFFPHKLAQVDKLLAAKGKGSPSAPEV